MARSFGLTYDYRCPFARLVHDHVVEGLRDGADWDVTFLPFSSHASFSPSIVTTTR